MDRSFPMVRFPYAGQLRKSFFIDIAVQRVTVVCKMIYREREDVQVTSESPYTCSDIRSPKSASKDRDAELEKAIYGSWSKGHGLKANGLMKKVRLGCASRSLFSQANCMNSRRSHLRLTG